MPKSEHERLLRNVHGFTQEQIDQLMDCADKQIMEPIKIIRKGPNFSFDNEDQKSEKERTGDTR